MRIILRPLALLLPFLAACERSDAWRNDRIEVAGELRADGTCTASLAGQPVLGATGPARVRMSVSYDTAVAGPTAGWAEWRLWCEGENAPTLMLRALHNPMHRVVPGTYAVAGERERSPQSVRMEGTLYDPPLPPDPGGNDAEWLEAFEGAVVFTQVNDTAPVGTFRLVTRRASEFWH